MCCNISIVTIAIVVVVVVDVNVAVVYVVNDDNNDDIFIVSHNVVEKIEKIERRCRQIAANAKVAEQTRPCINFSNDILRRFACLVSLAALTFVRSPLVTEIERHIANSEFGTLCSFTYA